MILDYVQNAKKKSVLLKKIKKCEDEAEKDKMQDELNTINQKLDELKGEEITKAKTVFVTMKTA